MNGLNSKSPILQITVECGDGYYRKCLTHSNEYLIQNPICPGLKDEVQDVLDTFDKMVYCYAKGITSHLRKLVFFSYMLIYAKVIITGGGNVTWLVLHQQFIL